MIGSTYSVSLRPGISCNDSRTWLSSTQKKYVEWNQVSGVVREASRIRINSSRFLFERGDCRFHLLLLAQKSQEQKNCPGFHSLGCKPTPASPPWRLYQESPSGSWEHICKRCYVGIGISQWDKTSDQAGSGPCPASHPCLPYWLIVCSIYTDRFNTTCIPCR